MADSRSPDNWDLPAHPRRQLETGFAPNDNTVAMCRPPAQALLNDLRSAADVVA